MNHSRRTVASVSPLFSTPTRSRRRHGFTLLQIIVVLAIVAVLAGLMFGAFTRSRKSVYRTTCAAHLAQISLALDQFKADFGYYPVHLEQLHNSRYIPDDSVFACPADPRETPSYEEYYAVRSKDSKVETGRPLMVCPFHEDTGQGNQIFVGNYASKYKTLSAVLVEGNAVTVEHPGKPPVAAPAGLELHGADRLRTTGSSSFALVRFSDDSQFRMGHDTDSTIMQSFVDGQTSGELYTLVRQTIGTVEYIIHKGSKFDVVTPTATAGALGTHFEVRVQPKFGTWVFCEEGSVRMMSGSGGGPIPNYIWNSTGPPPTGLRKGTPVPPPKRDGTPPPP